MKFKFLSDTHFEFFRGDNDVLDWIDRCLCDEQSRDTVLLHAGDLHRSSRLSWVLEELAGRFAHVVFVPGNHDFYGSSVESVRNQLRGMRIPNLHVLDPGSAAFDRVKIIGATLWTNLLEQSPNVVNEVVRSLNDFRLIEGMSSELFTRLHEQDVSFIEKELQSTPRLKTIVLTHHFPSHRCVHPKYKGSVLNFGFAAELDDLIMRYEPDYWLFGHTHEAVRVEIGRSRLWSNPFGYRYYEENPGFDSHLFLDF